MKFNLKEEYKEFKELSISKKFHVIAKVLTFIVCVLLYINKMYSLALVLTFFVLWDMYNIYKSYKLYKIEVELK